jgi:hypothetical protein
MRCQLREEIVTWVFSHQYSAEKHLTQSVKQCGKQENNRVLYIWLFNTIHIPKVDFL